MEYITRLIGLLVHNGKVGLEALLIQLLRNLVLDHNDRATIRPQLSGHKERSS